MQAGNIEKERKRYMYNTLNAFVKCYKILTTEDSTALSNDNRAFHKRLF